MRHTRHPLDVRYLILRFLLQWRSLLELNDLDWSPHFGTSGALKCTPDPVRFQLLRAIFSPVAEFKGGKGI
jgi:hypothetical protein